MSQRPAMSTAEHAQRARKHIFVVNGAPSFLDLLRDLLQEEDYNVTTTNYVPRTFAQVMALTPDLIVVDLALGVQAGWHLLDQLHTTAATQAIPVIVFSTLPSILDEAKALDAPDANRRFLGKPFDLSAFLDLVTELIGPA